MKRIALVLVLVMLAGMAAFPAMAQETTLTLLIDNSTNLPGIQAVAEEIKQKLGIGLEVEIRPSGPEGVNFVRTRLAAGEMTDLCAFNSGSLLTTLNPAKNFVDLTDMPYMSQFSDT